MARWVGTQGQVNLAKKARKHDPIMTLPTENLNPNRKFF